MADTDDLEQRLREPDWHDPACPFKTHCYCGSDGELPPHDRVRHPLAIKAADELARLRAENERLREALTPSGDTKAAYHGEFQFNIEYSDDEGGSYWQPHLVPWTTVKEIMAAIHARATLNLMDEALCSDCPPEGYPTDKMRCTPCPRRTPSKPAATDERVDEGDRAWLWAKHHDFNATGNHAMQRRIERIIAALSTKAVEPTEDHEYSPTIGEPGAAVTGPHVQPSQSCVPLGASKGTDCAAPNHRPVDQQGEGASPDGDQAFVATPSSQQAVSPVPASIPSAGIMPLLLAVYDAGIKRGNDEASAFEWGSSPSGKYPDELIDVLHTFANEGIDWDKGEIVHWDTVAEHVAHAIEARRAETHSGSVHESAGGNADAPNPDLQSLSTALVEAREALRPFAKAAEDLDGEADGRSMWEHHVAIDVTAGDFRRAATVFRHLSGDEG